MDLYREEILEHWRNPQNFGEMKKPDFVIEQVNPLCGDEVTFFFKLGRDKGRKGQSSKVKKGTLNNQSNTFEVGLPAGRQGSDSSKVRIADVRFTGSGCAISIASASLLSEVIKGKSLDKISKITGQDVLGLIGGNVAPARLKCAFLSLEALRKLRVNS